MERNPLASNQQTSAPFAAGDLAFCVVMGWEPSLKNYFM